jgi:hypothetical protein
MGLSTTPRHHAVPLQHPQLTAAPTSLHFRSTDALRTSPNSYISIISRTNHPQIFTTIVYRLTFHPLARYPGPPLARITDIYLTYYAYRGSRHLAYHRAHEQYGPIVRIGPNSLSINTATALKSIYGFRSNVRKADFYTAFPASKATVNVHSSIDKLQHARKRRVMSHAFSDSAIKSLERYILANVRTACRLLGEKPDGPSRLGKEKGGWKDAWNMANWCNWMVFDIMGDLVFGKAFGMLESPTNRFAVDLVGNAAHRHLIVSIQSRRVAVDANICSAAPTSPFTTGTSTRSSSARSPPNAVSTCNTANHKPWSEPRWV